MASGRPVIVHDVTRDPRYLATLNGTRAEMIVPVRDSSRRVVGTIDVESDRVGAFGPDDVRLLAGCAKVLAPLWEPIQMAQFSLPDRRAAGAPPEPWTNAAAYESHIGRWSRKAARTFVPWLKIPPKSHWLEVGCGTGALTKMILLRGAPASVRACDSSSRYVRHARASTKAARAAFVVADALALPVRRGGFDAVVSGLVLNFLPDPARAVAHMRERLRPGGRVGAYVWDYAEKMELMHHFWDAAVAVNPDAAAFDTGRRFPICRPDPLRELFESCGLRKVEVRAIDFPTHFKNFTDFWSPFLGGQGVAPGYVVSLAEDARVALREELRRRLPVEPDGSIRLMARAWAVKGTDPRLGLAERAKPHSSSR